MPPAQATPPWRLAAVARPDQASGLTAAPLVSGQRPDRPRRHRADGWTGPTAGGEVDTEEAFTGCRVARPANRVGEGHDQAGREAGVRPSAGTPEPNRLASSSARRARQLPLAASQQQILAAVDRERHPHPTPCVGELGHLPSVVRHTTRSRPAPRGARYAVWGPGETFLALLRLSAAGDAAWPRA